MCIPKKPHEIICVTLVKLVSFFKMYQLDETDDSGNEYNGENNSKMNDSTYWDIVCKNRKQVSSALGGMITRAK